MGIFIMKIKAHKLLETPSLALYGRPIKDIENPEVGDIGYDDLSQYFWTGEEWKKLRDVVEMTEWDYTIK